MQMLKQYPEPISINSYGGRVYLAGLRRSGQWRDEDVLTALCGSFGRIIWDKGDKQ